MKTKLSFTTLTKPWKFSYINSDIEKNFPLEPIRSSDYKLFHFDKYISSENVVKEMENEGYSPATLSELLSWKDCNRDDWVIALGQSAQVGGSRGVPGLWLGGGWRIDLNHWGGVWFSGVRFLAVRNSILGSSSLSDTLSLELRVEKLEEILKHYNLVLP